MYSILRDSFKLKFQNIEYPFKKSSILKYCGLYYIIISSLRYKIKCIRNNIKFDLKIKYLSILYYGFVGFCESVQNK